MTSAPAKLELRDLLRWHRERRGLSQGELAARVEPSLSPGTISNMERGRTRPYRHTLEALCRAFELPETERDAVWTAWRSLPTHSPAAARALADNLNTKTAPPRRHNLPERAPGLIGRDEAVATVRERLLTAKAGLLTLTGAGGSGKTSLALAVARQLVDQFADGVWLVELAPLRDPGELAGTIATSVGIAEQRGRPAHDTLLEVLVPRSLLLILDNCEHLLEPCADLVLGLLRTCPALRVMATSREALRIPGEWTWRVPTLPAPDARQVLTVAELATYPAVQLFVERAQEFEPAFQLTEENTTAVARICAGLDGLPLALELAAARVRLLTPEQIAARLEDAFTLLVGGSRSAPARQQTLRATLDWSYSLLSSAEQTLFRRCSVFAGGWTLAAAERVCAFPPIAASDVLDLTAHLVDKSLVIFDQHSGAGRYRLLETLRQYATERLVEAGDELPLRERHRRWCIALVEESERNIHHIDQVAWLDRLEMELDNVRAVLRWCLDANEPGVGLGMAAALLPFWQMRAYFVEANTWLFRLLQLTGGPCEPRTRARGLGAAAALFTSAGELRDADTFIEEALRICRAGGFQPELALALDVGARLAWIRGNNQLARSLQMEALQTS